MTICQSAPGDGEPREKGTRAGAIGAIGGDDRVLRGQVGGILHRLVAIGLVAGVVGDLVVPSRDKVRALQEVLCPTCGRWGLLDDRAVDGPGGVRQVLGRDKIASVRYGLRRGHLVAHERAPVGVSLVDGAVAHRATRCKDARPSNPGTAGKRSGGYPCVGNLGRAVRSSDSQRAGIREASRRTHIEVPGAREASDINPV